MAWERRTPGVLGVWGLLHWLVLSCSGSAFTSSPEADAGSGGAAAGSDPGASGGKPNAGSSSSAGATSDGGKPGSGGNAGRAGSAGNTSGSGGVTPQGEAGDGSGGDGEPEPDPSVPTKGLLYWFKADAGVEVDTDGRISKWADQSGNGFHATQAESDYQPKLSTTELLPLPVLEFDGSDDVLELPAFKQAFAGLTAFAVAGRSKESDCSGVIELSNGPEINDIFVGSVGNALQFEVQADWQLGPVDSWPPLQIKLLGVVQSADAVQPSAELRVDGAVISSMAMALPVTVERVENYIGRTLYANCSPSFSGAIAEIIMYTRPLSVEERLGVESYLMNKWQCCK